MNVEIGAEAVQFPEKEYIKGIAVAVRYVAAPCKHSHEESIIQPSRIPILRASRLGTIISLQTYRQPIWPTVLSSNPAGLHWGSSCMLIFVF
jgi:hypothetical protein